MTRSLKNAAKVTLLLLGSVLVCAATAELVVRIRYGDKFGKRPGFYIADPLLGWKPAPDLHHVFYGPDYQIAIRTDADGYRLGARGAVDYSKELVVLCGDSYAFGWGVGTDQTFASYLDQAMNARSGGRLRVVNLGVGGYGMFQNCDRLGDFFQRHDGVEPRVVIIQHTVNDATDNFRNIGYHLGLWRTETLRTERSRLHVMNLVRYVLDARRQARSGTASAAKEPYVRDLLWSYRRTEARAGIPESVVFGTRTLRFDPATLKADATPDSLLRRKKLTPIQRDLMFEALTCIHEIALSHHAVVVHTFIATTPEWYVEEVAAIARRSADFTACHAVVTGAMPKPGEFVGKFENEHSGGHFNGEFNRFWADAMVEFLSASNLLPLSPPEALAK